MQISQYTWGNEALQDENIKFWPDCKATHLFIRNSHENKRQLNIEQRALGIKNLVSCIFHLNLVQTYIFNLEIVALQDVNTYLNPECKAMD